MRLLWQFYTFFYGKILHAQKRTKKHQKAPKSTKKHKNAFEQEQKNANKRIKIKNAPKNI